MSCTSVLLPEPETPVTAVSAPMGMSTSTDCRLCSVAPRSVIHGPSARRTLGIPIRFLPEYDNLLLSHRNRKRVVADEYRAQVYLPGLRVAATILVDGFVRGAWTIEKTKTAATLVIEPFEKLTKKDRAALTEEGERLVQFVEANAKSFEVKFHEGL